MACGKKPGAPSARVKSKLLTPLPCSGLVSPCFASGVSIHSAALAGEWSVGLRLLAAYLPAPGVG